VGLLVVRLDLDPRPGLIGIEIDPLGPNEIREAGPLPARFAHGAGP